MSSDKIKKELKDLLKEPDNRYCADCPIKGPTWASVNIGVWICMPCSGIHRSLGVHITQVRSVDLDKWKPEWVEVMRAWGNAKANAVWEAKLPKGFDGKPNEMEAQELTPKMQKFIKDKYERKRWYSDSGASKKKAGSDESSSEDESEEDEKPAKKASSSKSTSSAAAPATSTTTKKPLIVMKTSGARPIAPAKAAPAASNPETLLDSFDPFGDNSFEPTFQSAPAQALSSSQASSSMNAFDDFVSATPSAPPAAVAAAPAKPTFDLNSLYGMSSNASAHGAQQMQWQSAQPSNGGFPSTPGAYPAQHQHQQTFEAFPTTSSGNSDFFNMQGFSSMPTSMPTQHPAQMAQQSNSNNNFFQGFQQAPPQFNAQQQPFVGYHQQPPVQHQPQGQQQTWPPMNMGQQPQQGKPRADSKSDPFAGLF